jgi:hypothetical protein
MKSRRMRWARYIARIDAKRNAYWILVGKPKGRRPLERPSWDNVNYNYDDDKKIMIIIIL